MWLPSVAPPSRPAADVNSVDGTRLHVGPLSAPASRILGQSLRKGSELNTSRLGGSLRDRVWHSRAPRHAHKGETIMMTRPPNRLFMDSGGLRRDEYTQNGHDGNHDDPFFLRMNTPNGFGMACRRMFTQNIQSAES